MKFRRKLSYYEMQIKFEFEKKNASVEHKPRPKEN